MIPRWRGTKETRRIVTKAAEDGEIDWEDGYELRNWKEWKLK